jgi:tetratricopeptide (TPR) repeat protein
MIRRLIIIFLIVSPALQVSAQEFQAEFSRGNNFYQQGEYENALDVYNNILDIGLESGELYYNLGNTYYKLNNMGRSRLYYERALRLLKNDQALEENIQLLKLRLVDKIQTPPRFILYVWRDGLLDVFSMNLLSWLTAGLLWLLLIIAAVRQYFIKRHRDDRLKYLLVTAAALFVICTLLFSQKIINAETEEYGVIQEPSVTLYAEPSAKGTEVFMLHEGSKVKIQRDNNEWLEIRLEDGKTGWIDKTYLEII